ncbi:uncharacterized protein UBRO_20968 [Ustilago bromivora]|uniref:Reverse transcriptase domain-containing protein n=1 Tax=Ustilago bromivora TaxID=307758 RepID=A0A1K0GDT8_9BASI|nr:uncharacterized protein UBRO_20968 [Ustilago bromivora]
MPTSSTLLAATVSSNRAILPSSLLLPASALSLAEPSALASAPTTAATTAATASTPSRLTPPLPPTIFLTEDSPAFCSLQQQLNDQASALSDIATSLQHILTSLHNPEPWPPQPPSSQPVATTLTSTTLPAANTAGSALGAPLPGESEVDCIFSWLSQEVVQQVIHNTLPPQDLGRLCNPDSLLVDNKHEHAVLVNGVLIKSIPSTASTSSTCHFTKLIPDVCCFAEAWTIYTCIWACTTNDPNLSAGLGAFLLHVIQTDRMHTWLSVISYVLITCRQCFGHASAALWAQQDQAAWNQHLSTAASFHPPPKSATPGSANRQADTQLSGPPSKCQKGLKVCFRYNGGGCPEGMVALAATASRTAPDPIQVATPRRPTGLDGLVSLTPLSPAAPDLGPAQRPPPPQGLAWHIDGPAGPPDLSTPPLQGLAQLGSAWSVIMPAGLGGTRTPLLQGLARLFNLVLAALDVSSADWCLSLLLDVWSHDPGLCPNTSFAGNVFNPVSQPTRHSSMQEHAFAWSTLLSLYPDPVYCCQLLSMTEHGCLLGYDGLLCNAACCSDNLPISSAGHSHLCREIDARLAKGHLSVILASTNLIELPIGVVPKPHSTKLCTIHHLSHPCQPTATALPSINASISPGFIRIWYKGLQDLLAFVSQNLGCLLWKGDLEDAFQHVMTAECDMHLLSFSYDGICYCENKLTFGGSSSPWLFNLVAMFLHWLVTACLPTDWPINHYLDDTFSAIPVLHTVHALLPVHTLALAANALGLQLSPKKTFGASTKLEVLGWIAGLLQFMSQVFLCRKAFLRHLYNATCCALPSKHCLTQPARSELIWWCDVLEHWSGTSILSPSLLAAAHVWTDSCPKGYGSYLGLDTSPTAVFAKTIPHCHHKKNICFLEALAVLEALRCFLPHWSGPTLVMVHVDNKNVKHGLCLGCSHDLLTQCLLWEIFGLCLKHDLTIQPHPSASNILGSAHPVFWPQASNCWSGSPTSPALVALFTRPSTGSVPSNPTTWTLASTPQVSPVAASSTPCTVTSACMVLATQALSSLSPCRSSTRSSLPWEIWPTSSPKTTLSFRRPLPLPLPASSTQASWSGTTALTVPPSSQSPPSGGHPTMLCSPSPPPRLTLSSRVCMLSPQKWVVSSAWLLVSGTSPMVAHLRHHSLALALLASTLSPSLPLSPSSAAPSRLAASWHHSTPATLSIVAWPPGCHSMVPPLLTSSHLAGGALTATATTLTDWLRSAALWSHQPSSLSAMAPWFPVALPGEIQAWPDPSLLAPDPIETALSCAGALMTGLAGQELLSSSPRLDPCNPFSVFSSWPCPCPI